MTDEPTTRPDPHAIEGGFFAPTDGGSDLAAQLADLEARYRGVIDHLPAVIYIDGVGDDTPMIDVSPGIEDLLGVSREDYLREGSDWSDYIHPDDHARMVAASELSVATESEFHEEFRAVHADGRVVWVREDALLIRDDQGKAIYWLGIMLDITQLVEAKRDLHHVQSTYGALVEQIPAIVYQDKTDESWSTVYVSPQITTLLGVLPEEWTGESKLWLEMLHPDDRERAIEEVDRGIESGEPYTVEYRMVARDGRVKWFQDTALMLRDADGNPAYTHGVMLDITERREAEERLTYLAYHDSLTGMPNRAMFDELLELSLARARRGDRGVAVLALDVDNFKLVNDSLGHEVGDHLIIQIAARLQDATRDTDLVARPGGDEFLMLLADLDQTSPVIDENGAAISAQAVAHRVLEAFEAPFEVDGTELYVTASIGISVYPLDAADATSLLRNADSAVYLAKETGPGGYVLNHLENDGALTKLSLSTRLRKAVEQEEWTLHYQPTHQSVHRGDVRGGGADPLARPRRRPRAARRLHPAGRGDGADRGDRCLGRGGDLPSGRAVARRRARARDRLQPVAPPALATRPGPADRRPDRGRRDRPPADHGRDHRVDRDARPRPHARRAPRFKDHGLKLAIDDFGTGYSSLSRLRYMPVDVLKIDRAFVRDVNADRQSASMVSAIIALASNLQMESLAEGIETEEEWRFLAARGCPAGQGFLFSKPVPAAEISAMHRRAGMTVIDGGLAV